MKRRQFVICCSIETQFVKDDSIGGSYVNSTIYKLPFELHLPGYKFTGSGTKPDKKLNADRTPKEWSIPINRVDNAAYHDL